MTKIAIVGAGPAGLIAAEFLGQSGASVTIFDQMASPARKFLLAGLGGLNLTHSEPMDRFLMRYGNAAEALAPAIRAFPPEALRAWCEGLGEKVFVGSSGRVFPQSFKAAPLLRAWLRRLDGLGVVLRARHRWLGWDAAGALRFDGPDGGVVVKADATVLALGGASWPRMGSDGGWVELLAREGVSIRPLMASNCGVTVGWSEIFRTRFAGVPLKRIALSFGGQRVTGEAMITDAGLEGGAVYAVSGPVREALGRGAVSIAIDLRPDLDDGELARRLETPARGRSLGNYLRQELKLSPAAIGLVQEARHGAGAGQPLAEVVRALPVTLTGMQPIERAISSAGGVRFSEVTLNYELRARRGVFLAGEMLDWEAPTGGYLLQACFSTGVAAARAIVMSTPRTFV